jgi:hypothetical protein
MTGTAPLLDTVITAAVLVVIGAVSWVSFWRWDRRQGEKEQQREEGERHG